MDTDRKWVVVRIDGKIAAISTDYRLLAEISSRLAEESKKASKGQKRIFGEIAATSVSTTDILELRQTLTWVTTSDLHLSPHQIRTLLPLVRFIRQ